MPEPLIVSPSSEAIAAAVRHLQAGRLVAFPTETVYGLGADARNDTAVAAIYAAKGRPAANPLILHAAGIEAAERIARFDRRARALAEAFWPGALTLALRRAVDGIAVPRVSAGRDTIAIRVPDHALALRLLDEAGFPIAAPSANPSGRVSPTTAEHVAEGLGTAVAMILDGGPCRLGIESTVVGLTAEDPVLLRPGAITREQLEPLVGPLSAPDAAAGGETSPIAPGLLERHYAPLHPLRLDAHTVTGGEALLSFGQHAIEGAAAERNLSPSGDLDEAAANLFRMLRELDRPGIRAIAVMPIPEHGLGAAINDRLRRGAAGTSGT